MLLRCMSGTQDVQRRGIDAPNNLSIKVVVISNQVF